MRSIEHSAARLLRSQIGKGKIHKEQEKLNFKVWKLMVQIAENVKNMN